MHSSVLFLGLIAMASAIDIRGHGPDNCAGSYRACTNINPDICCNYGTATGFASVAVVAIPTQWRIRCNSWTGGGCRSLGTQLNSNGATSVCLIYTSRGDRTGGSYVFLNNKRAENQSCTSSIDADVLGLADGTEYNIVGLSEEEVTEMETIAATGAGADAMPAKFKLRRRSIEA